MLAGTGLPLETFVQTGKYNKKLILVKDTQKAGFTKYADKTE